MIDLLGKQWGDGTTVRAAAKLYQFASAGYDLRTQAISVNYL
jgi:hypothetical protein